ncbi:MAG TPA: glycosyltransferase family 9 protein [Candidatus Binataceae bacterium]|nr:glycosyltransferase family 9 protein [Candidatus Binataceae bacterium]
MARFVNEVPDPRRVLVIFPGALGDLICALPALRTIAGRNPGWGIELMARPELARFAVGRMGVARGHSIDRRELSHLFATDRDKSSEARGFFGAFQKIYSFFGGDDARFRRGLAAVAGGATAFIPFRPPGAGHVAQCYLEALGHADQMTIQSDASALHSIDVLDQDIVAASQTLSRHGLGRGEFLLIFPGSGSPRKNWPADNFAALARRINSITKPVIVLGPAETSIESLFRTEFVTLSRLELGEVAGLACLARGFVGNDSGVSHLAAASGARGVVLFGPTDPERWCPLGHVDVVRREPLDKLPFEEVAAKLRASLTIADGDD